MPALYRTYRPQTFDDVMGQAHIITTLQNASAQHHPVHAYIFTGTRGVGKTTVARIFAKAVNCLQSKNGEACDKCEHCKAITAGNFLDLIEIDAASNTGVENVRELIEHVKFQPSRGKYKVFIIDEAHMLSRQAFNALLKTLEEPPAHAIFILATTEAYKIPITILSRAQRFDFKPLREQEIIDQLHKVLKAEKQKLSEETIAHIAKQAAGSVRDALSLLDKLLSIGPDADSKTANILLGVTDFGLHNQLFLMIKNGQTQLLPKFFEQLMADGTDFQIFNKDFLQYLRQALVLSVTKESLNIGLTENEQKELENSISEITSSSILLIIRLFLRSFKDMAQTPSPELPMLLASIEASIGLSKPISVKIDTIPADVPVAKTVSTEKKLNIDKLVQTPTTDQASLAVSNSEVEAFWPEVVSAIKTINSPLATLIKNSPIALVDKGVITLEVKYQFHKEHIESNKHYALITGIIEQVSGKRMALSIIVRSPEQNVQTPTEVLGSVLQVFGGELVE